MTITGTNIIFFYVGNHSSGLSKRDENIESTVNTGHTVHHKITRFLASFSNSDSSNFAVTCSFIGNHIK